MNEFSGRKRVFGRKLPIAYGVMFFFAGLACVFMPQVLLSTFSLDEVAVAVAGYFMIGIAVTLFVYLYLVGEINFRLLDVLFAPVAADQMRPLHMGDGPVSLRDIALAEQVLRDDMKRLSEEVQQLKKGQVEASAGDRDSLINAIRPTLVDDVARKVGEKIAESLPRSVAIEGIRSAFSQGSRLLDEQLRGLNKRSAINLAIGSGITCVAAGLLLYLVWGQSSGSGNTWQAMVHFYVPRLAAVTFVEVFGFFFLRQYKATLLELKACRQEQIDLIAKFAAVELGWASEEAAAKTSIGMALIQAVDDRLIAMEGHSGVDSGKVIDLLSAFAKAVGKGEK